MKHKPKIVVAKKAWKSEQKHIPAPHSEEKILDNVLVTGHAADRFMQRFYHDYTYRLWEDRERYKCKLIELYKQSVPVDFRWKMTPFYVNKRNAMNGFVAHYSKCGDVVFTWKREGNVAVIVTVTKSPTIYDNEVF